MQVFWRRTKKVEDWLEQYMENVDDCVELFLKGMQAFLRDGRTIEFESLVDDCRKAENSADRLRRDIEIMLYGKALLPESRGDLLGLLESFDRVPNSAETVLHAVSCQRMDMPKELAGDFQRLVDSSAETYGLLRKAFDVLMDNPKQTLYVVKEVEEAETRCDQLERGLIGRIFDTEYSFGRKLLLKDLVLLIGNIPDRSENTADRIGIVAVKRKV